MKWQPRKRRRRARTVQVCVECLEARRLLAAQLSLNSTTGVLGFMQQSGVNDNLAVNVTAFGWSFTDTTSTVAIDSTLTSAGWMTTPNGQEAFGPNLPQVKSVLVDTGDGTDSVTVRQTTVPITCASLALITLTLGDGTAATELSAPVTFDGTNSGASLVVDDADDTAARSISINSSSMMGVESSPIIYDAAVSHVELKAGTGETIAVNGTPIALNQFTPTTPSVQVLSTGHDTVEVNATPLNSDVLVNAIADGSDDVTVLPQTVLGDVSEGSDSGLSTLVVDDSADTQPRSIAYEPVASLGAVSGFGTGVYSLDNGVGSLTIKGGSGGNTWTIDPRIGYTRSESNTIDTGTGNDTVTVRTVTADETINVNNDGGNAAVDVLDYADMPGIPSILGPIDVTNSAGSTVLKIDESASDVAHTVTVTGSQVSGLTQGVEQFSGVANVSLIGSLAGDAFSVTPSASTAFSINGGPAVHPTARLNVDIAGSSQPMLSSTGTSTLAGSYTFADAQPVSFSNMAEIAPIIASCSGRVYNGQDLTPIVDATVFADENGNGIADPGEPATTTNASGSYVLAGIPVGTVNLIVNATPSNSFVTQSRSVSLSEAMSATADFELLPPDSANRADLVGAFVGTAPGAAIIGRKGKFKIKVANAGAAIAAGTPLVELFASADTSLDETDHPIATFSLGKIKLKPDASKVLSASFVYPSSLPTGTYFLLASVDSTNVIAESNEANNISATSTAIRIGRAAADLAGQFGPLATIPLAGQAFSLPLVIDNLGNIAANGPIDVDLFASADQTLDAADQALAANLKFRIHIKAGGSQLVTLKIPAGVTTPGSVYLIADINATGSLPESSFANNDVVSGEQVMIV